jgi:type IV secretion system protein VirB9
MPLVRWRYAASDKSANGIPQVYAGVLADLDAGSGNAGSSKDEQTGGIDPRYLSFNYKITYARFGRPKWTPYLAYDDGRKTYLQFPKGTLQAEMPAVFENKADVVNYRVVSDLIIIDKLIEKITVKLDGKQVTIEKKKGA